MKINSLLADLKHESKEIRQIVRFMSSYGIAAPPGTTSLLEYVRMQRAVAIAAFNKEFTQVEQDYRSLLSRLATAGLVNFTTICNYRDDIGVALSGEKSYMVRFEEDGTRTVHERPAGLPLPWVKDPTIIDRASPELQADITTLMTRIRTHRKCQRCFPTLLMM